MARNEQTPVTAGRKAASPWGTAIGLSVWFLGALYLVTSTESTMLALGGLMVAALVTLLGVLGHALALLWALVKGRPPAARRSLTRAAMYLVFGLASLTTARLQLATVPEFRDHLKPGTSLDEAVRRLDALYTSHPKQWRFISLWGTTRELSIDDYQAIGKSEEDAPPLYWRAEEPRSRAALAEAAAALAPSLQVWFTFRTDVGFVHFFVTLDERGLIRSVSEITGHQV